MDTKEIFWLRIIYILSIVISFAIIFLILGPRPANIGHYSLDVSILPTVNATLNFITTLLLITALIFIKNKKIDYHKNTMLCAFGTSALFLTSYIIYHWFKAGPKEYIGEFSILYYFILSSHIILAMIIIPLSLITLYRGWNSQINKHRRIAKITFPVWLYVSITGIVIYLMLY